MPPYVYGWQSWAEWWTMPRRWEGLVAMVQLGGQVRDAVKGAAAMPTQLRKTGLGVLGDMPWGTHCCHFYQTQKELLETLVSPISRPAWRAGSSASGSAPSPCTRPRPRGP